MADESNQDVLPAGTVIGGYVIRQVLGQGGFGITYEAASQTGFVERRVAIKEFFPEKIVHRIDGSVVVSGRVDPTSYQAALQRFEGEAQKLIDFYDHPCIVRGENVVHAHGSVFFIMEFIEGQSLHDYLIGRGGFLPEAELRPLLDPVLDAVGHIHDQGAMHRDLSPKNIMVRLRRRNRDVLEPVLIDFGALGEGIDTIHDSTIAVANPSFAPPEQQSPEGAFQGRFTDIFALAGVLYAAAAGRPPMRPMVRLSATASGGRADPYVPLEKAVVAHDLFSPQFLAGVDQALQLRTDLRPQTIAQFRKALGWDVPNTAAEAILRRDPQVESSEEATQIFGAPPRPTASRPTPPPPGSVARSQAIPRPPDPPPSRSAATGGRQPPGPPPRGPVTGPTPGPAAVTPPPPAADAGTEHKASDRSLFIALAVVAAVAVLGVIGLVSAGVIGPGAGISASACTKSGLEAITSANDDVRLRAWIESCSGSASTLLMDAARTELARLSRPQQQATGPTQPPATKPQTTPPQTTPPQTPPQTTPPQTPPVTPTRPGTVPPAKPDADPPVANPGVTLQQQTGPIAFFNANETRSELREPGTPLLTTKAVWKTPTEIAALPQGSEIVFSTHLQFAEHFDLEIVMRRNTRDLLPASHVMEFRFTPLPGFTGRSIARVDVPLLKKANLPDSPPLALVGKTARVGPNLFQIVLPSADPAKTNNLKLFAENRFMDVNLAYEDGRLATLLLLRLSGTNP